jgi:SAM-dependent methyltransferase
MALLGRRRRRHQVSPGSAARARRTVVVELPGAPGAVRRPSPLTLSVPHDRGGWALPDDADAVAELAAFLASVDAAPAGAVLDVGAGSGDHALLAAVYGSRIVRAVEPDPVQAHAARQAAASNALAVVVDELRLDGAGESLAAYVQRTALDAAIVRLGAGVDAAAVLAGGLRLLRERRPWLVLRSAEQARAALHRLPEMVAVGYRVITETASSGASRGYVLAPEAVPAAFWRRLEAWSAALRVAAVSRIATAAGSDATPGATVVDLRAAEGASTTS